MREPAGGDQQIGIAPAVASLRRELRLAMASAAEEDLRFDVERVVLDFAVEVSLEKGAGGGIRFWVVSAGGKRTRTTAATHRVTIELHPASDGGEPVQIVRQPGAGPPVIGPQG